MSGIIKKHVFRSLRHCNLKIHLLVQQNLNYPDLYSMLDHLIFLKKIHKVLLGDNSSWVSCILACFESKTIDPFVPDYLFKDINKQPGKVEIV